MAKWRYWPAVGAGGGGGGGGGAGATAGVYEADVYVTGVYDDGTVATSAAPTIGAGLLLTSNPNAQTTSWLAASGSGFTPATGDALLRMLALDNGTGQYPPTVTVGGATVTFRAGADAGHGGTSRGVMLIIGTVRGLPTGSPLDVVVTTPGAAGIGRVVIMLSDLAGWGGSVGATNQAIVTGTSVAQISASITLTRPGGLLVGVAGSANANTTPLSVVGWTSEGETTVNTTAGASSDAIFVTATGVGAGSVKALTATSGTAWTDFGAGLIELY